MASIALSKAESNLNRFAVLATYRHLLRATRIAFEGDHQMLLSARTFARKEFRNNRKLDSGSLEAATAVEHAQGVAQILRENVVQGKHMGGEQYKLNIHEHTQRLENETASKLKGTTKSFQDIKSATF